MLALSVFLCALISCAFSANVYESCTSNGDCSVLNSHCAVVSPSCGSGSCTCLPGHYPEGSEKCGRAVGYDGDCSEEHDTCVAKGAKCIDGKCKCPEGWMIGPGDAKAVCIAAGKDKGVGDQCASNDECFPDYAYCETNDKRCHCAPGFEQSGKYDCIMKTVDSACSGHDECLLPGSECKDGKCQCKGSKQAVTNKRMTYTQMASVEYFTAMGCSDASPSGEGEMCSYGKEKEEEGGEGRSGSAPAPGPGPAPGPAPPPAYNYNYGRKKRQAAYNYGGSPPAAPAPGAGGSAPAGSSRSAAATAFVQQIMAGMADMKACAAPFECMKCSKDDYKCARPVASFYSDSTKPQPASLMALAIVAATAVAAIF